MSTISRNLQILSGVNIDAPAGAGFQANGLANYPDDAAFEADKTPAVGDLYFNTTELCLREYNGTAWQYDKTIYATQTDSTTTGSGVDLAPGVAQMIRFTQGSLASIRSISPSVQRVLFLVNGQASQVITLKNEDATATAANRIVTGTGADFPIAAGQAVQLIYDQGGTRWRLAGAASSGGSGTGGVNLITSPSTATGWSETGTVFATPETTTASSDLPLEGATNSAIKFVATGSGAEATNYNSFPVTTSAAMNGRLQVDFFHRPGTGFVASEWTVSVYQGSTRIALDADSAGVCFVPNSTNRFTVSFDALANTAYTLRFARISGSGSATLNVCNVFLGWPFVSSVSPQGIYEKVTTFTIGAVTTPPTPGAGATFLRETVRDGSDAIIRYEFRQTAAGTTGSGDYLLPLPTGLNIDYNRAGLMGNSFSGAVGYGTMQATALNYNLSGHVLNSGAYVNKILCVVSNEVTANTSWSGTTATLANNTLSMSVLVRIPIVEWAGSVSTAPVPAEEFLGHNGTSQTTDWALIPNIAGATLTTAYTIVPSYPCQNDDELELEFKVPSTNDIISNGGYPFLNGQSSFIFGVQARKLSNGNIGVTFGNAGFSPTAGLGAVAAGNTWADFRSSGWQYRVRKTKKWALPFRTAGKDGSSGLYKPGEAPGYVGGLAVAAGYIGEIMSATTTTAISTSPASLATLILTPGVWTVSGSCRIGGDTTPRYILSSISTVTNTMDSVVGRTSACDYNASTGVGSALSFPRTFSVAVSTQVYFVALTSTISGVSSTNTYLEAVRIG